MGIFKRVRRLSVAVLFGLLASIPFSTDAVFAEMNRPEPPTNLQAEALVTRNVNLHWDSVPNTFQYTVWRDGTIVDGINNGGSEIAHPTTNSWTDYGPSDGYHTYYVTARVIDTVTGSDTESFVSNGVTVFVDTIEPVISATRSPLAAENGWNNTDVTVSFTCNDPLGGSGIAYCPSPVIVSEGANQSVSGAAVDNVGNVSRSVTVDLISVDKTPPTTPNIKLSSSLLLPGLPVHLTGTTSDATSGIWWAEFYVDNDPGQGNAEYIGVEGGPGTRNIDGMLVFDNLSIGYHTVYVRTQDLAGNWSQVGSVRFFYL